MWNLRTAIGCKLSCKSKKIMKNHSIKTRVNKTAEINLNF